MHKLRLDVYTYIYHITYVIYLVNYAIYFQTEVDIIEDIDEYQTWPGWFILLFRSAIMIWFLCELRNTMTYEHNTQKLHFLLHFGASSLVWFIYLPIIALIALQVSALWRFKLLLGKCESFAIARGLCLNVSNAIFHAPIVGLQV